MVLCCEFKCLATPYLTTRTIFDRNYIVPDRQWSTAHEILKIIKSHPTGSCAWPVFFRSVSKDANIFEFIQTGNNIFQRTYYESKPLISMHFSQIFHIVYVLASSLIMPLREEKVQNTALQCRAYCLYHPNVQSSQGLKKHKWLQTKVRRHSFSTIS